MTSLTADDFFQAQFYVLAAATVCLTAWSRYSDRGDGSKSAGAALARTYLPVYALIMTSDWLQGPYMYRLLSVNHGYTPSGIAALFVVGFLSAAVASPVVGRWADMYGRRTLCLAFCALYASSCLMICINSVPVCVLARMAGGVSTSILFSVPETWLVSASHSSQLSPGTLSSIFGSATLVNGFVAVVSGVTSNWAVEQTGTAKTPFLVAAGVLGLAALAIRSAWTENYGQQGGSHESVQAGFMSAWSAISGNRVLLTLAFLQTTFETSMYLFVFLWVPQMELVSGTFDGSFLPLGLIFSCFMCCMMLGSLLYSYIVKHSTSDLSLSPTAATASISKDGALILHAKLASVTFLVASIALGLTGTTDKMEYRFWAFCAFEGTVGMYFPVLGWLKSELIPDEVRAHFSSLFRLPLNILVTVSLLLGVETRQLMIFNGCAMALAAGSIAVNYFVIAQAGSTEAGYSSVDKGVKFDVQS